MEEDKATLNNYRPAIVPGKSCHTCILKKRFPWMWCDVIGRQADMGRVCSQWKGKD